MVSWQKIIWREWRHCADIDYEEHLFAVVADEPVGWGSRLCLILFNAITGATIALLLGFVVTLKLAILLQLMLAGALVGAASGYVTGRELTWREWLARLQANTPSEGASQLIFSSVIFVLVSGMIFGPLAWLSLVGFFWGVGGVIHWINRATSDSDTYRSGDRNWWFWWYKRPHFSKVKIALAEACVHSETARDIWKEPLHRLEKERLPHAPQELIRLLLSSDWVQRLSASDRLLSIGPSAVPVLEEVATQEARPLRTTARWLLENIAAKTS